MGNKCGGETRSSAVRRHLGAWGQRRTCPYVHSSKHISHILNQVEKINKHSTIKEHDTPTIHKRDKNKFLLCSKGKYIQYLVIKYNGKECEVENIYAYIYLDTYKYI